MPKVVNIAGIQYDERDCRYCDATGTAYDSTFEDKISQGAYPNRCSHCAGKGITHHRVPAPEIVANDARQTARLRAALASNCDPNADLPDWMM